MKSNDFDRIAFVYDRLARSIFGESIANAQYFFLSQIRQHAKVLILGGGSGWILKKLFELNPTVEVCYIEASEKMISRAQAGMKNDERVQFLCGTENDIPDRVFDAVITNFYLDLFDEQMLNSVVKKIKTKLSPNATWIATDFVNKNWWHRLMLNIMYVFFKLTAKIEASKLPDWNSAVAIAGGRKTHWKLFYRGFIETSVFQF